MKNCVCLAGILAKILAHQAELAATIASDHEMTNRARRAALAGEISANAADFQSFVAGYQIPVKKRTSPPSAKGCK